MGRPLLRLQQGLLTLVLAQSSADSSGLLWAEVEWEVLLALVEQAELRALVGVDDCEDLCDRFAEIVTVEMFMLVSAAIPRN